MSPNGILTLEDIGSFLSKLAERSENVYWLSSHDFEKIQYVSPAYEKIWGRSREELYKDPQKWITFLHPDDVKNPHPIEAMRERVAKLGADARYTEDYRIIRPDGEVRWIIDRGFPIIDQSGNCCGVTGVATDVTKEKKIEEALQEAKDKAELANQAKTEFLMNMRHDFRTPFTGILGMADIMARQETEPEKKKNLSCIAQAAKSLLDRHNEIFEFARLENGSLPVLEKKFNLYDLLTDAKNMVQPSATQKGLDFEVYWSDDAPEFLIGDKMRMHRILMNLLSNAVKFTQKGKVTLKATLAKKENKNIIIRFEVQDSGMGIPEDRQDLIYEKFTRLTSSYSGNYSGMGYGLRFVKRYLDDLGGEVSLDTVLGAGTTFTLLVPFKLPLLSR